MQRSSTLEQLKENAQVAADFLLVMANDKRLLILCELMEAGEMSVGALAAAVDLSQSALSQHLAKLRAEEFVATRRESQTIYYRLTPDARVRRAISLLKQLFCR